MYTKKDFCEGCSFLGLYNSLQNNCIICQEPVRNEDYIAEMKFSSKGFHYENNLGYYQNLIDGYAPKFQARSSAGGLITALLEELLFLREVDYLLLVGYCSKTQTFKYHSINTSAELLNFQRSAYFPIKISDAIDIINSNSGTCAITCIPSAAKALELLKIDNPDFAKKLKYTIGLTYHSTKTIEYTDYFCKKAGKLDGLINCDYVSYRDKPNNSSVYRNAGDFVVKSNEQEWRLPGKAKPMDWSIGLLQEFSSHFVDDHFCECADISVMDAWHPRYNNSGGVSLAIIRNNNINNILNTSKNVHINYITKEIILESQKHGIESKTKGLQFRLFFFRLFNKNVPIKRVNPTFLIQPLFLLLELIRMLISMNSLTWYKKSHSIRSFEIKIKFFKYFYIIIYKLNNLF